jgi:hypothetical protein
MNVGTSTSTQGAALAEGRSGVLDPFADRDNDADANADALALIKRLVARCRSPLLDRPIVHYEASVVCDFADAITMRSQWPVWIDIPISAVVGLHHINFTAKGAPWVEALTGLTSRDWDARVFDYWSGEVRDQDFPATGARRALRVKCLAGAVLSENGVHRLTAGVAWLCATRGDTAQLRKVRTRICDQRSGLVDAVVDLARESQQLEVARRDGNAGFHGDEAAYAVRATSHRGRIRIFDVNIRSGQFEQRQGSRFAWRTRDIEPTEEWQMLPKPLLDAWTASGWLAAATAGAERCPTDVD